MSQSTTFEFQAKRSTELLNRQQFKVTHSGLYSGYNVVIDTGVTGAAVDTIKIVNAPDLTSVSVSRGGVRIEETGPDPVIRLDIAVGDGSDPRIDLVVVQHTFSTSNNPATYSVIAGTPAASPVPPAIPADAVVLAEVHVAQSAAAVTNDNIIRRAKELASIDDEDTSRLNNIEEAAHKQVADLTALAAIPPESRFNGQVILVVDVAGIQSRPALYQFDSTESATADGFMLVTPTAFAVGTDGRWRMLSSTQSTFVAYTSVSGSQADYLTLSAALKALEDSPAKDGIIYVLMDSQIDVAVTTTKPVKIIGVNQTNAGGKVSVTLLATWDVNSPASPPGISDPYPTVHFENIGLGNNTDGVSINMLDSGYFFMRDCILSYNPPGSGQTFIDLSLAVGKGVIDLVNTVITTDPGNSMFGYSAVGAELEFKCRTCVLDGGDLDDLIFRNDASLQALNFHLLEHTFWRADGFASGVTNGIISVFLDGTSIFMGQTEVPANIDTVQGVALYDQAFDTAHSPGWENVLEFLAGKRIEFGPGTFLPSVNGVLQTFTVQDLDISGDSRETTILDATMNSTPGVNGLEWTAGSIRIRDLSFIIRADPANATGTAFRMVSGNRLRNRLERLKFTLSTNQIAIGVEVNGIVMSQIEILGDTGVSTDKPDISLKAGGCILNTIRVNGFNTTGMELNGRTRAQDMQVSIGPANIVTRGYLVQISTLRDSLITSQNTAGAVGMPIGIEVIGDTGTDSPGSQVINCEINGFESGGSTIDITDAILLKEERSIIQGNIISNVGDAGIELDATAVHNTIIGNNFRDCTGRACRDIGTENNFVGNTSKASGGGVAAIDVSGSSGSLKSGNLEVV